MWKKILPYYLIGGLLLLLVFWRIAETGLHTSVIPGMEQVPAKVLWIIVTMLSLAYLIVAFQRVKKSFADKRNTEAWLQIGAFLMNIILFVCFWLV